MHLKKKKQLEGQVATLEAGLDNLDQMIDTISNHDSMMLLYNSMNQATNELKKMNKNLDAEKIDDGLLEAQDQMEIAQSISTAISTPFSVGTPIDEDDLLREMDELMAANEAEQQVPAISLPSVPTSTIPSALPAVPTTALSEEARQLAELESSLAF